MPSAKKDAKAKARPVTLPVSAGVCPEAYAGQHVTSASVGYAACLLCGRRVIPPGQTGGLEV